MKKEYRHLLILLGLTALLCLCCFLPNIIANIPLTYGTDIKTEQFFFVEEFNNQMNAFINSGSLPFYSWHMFLGNNYYSSMGFYGNADLFNFIGLLLQGMNFFDRTMLLEILKMFIASFSMYWLLSQYQFKPWVKYIGSLCFAFSGWSIFYSGQTMFLSFYCLTPIYFVGIEKYLQNRKPLIFILSSIILCFTNWYFLYSVAIFTPIYYVYRYYLIKDNFKTFIKDTAIIIGFFLLAMGITAFYLLPTITYISQNDRVGGLVGILSFDKIQVYLNQLISSFVPNFLYLYKTNALDTGWHVTREICLWATGLVGILSIQSLFIKANDKFRKASRILYLVLVVILILPIGDSIMHGFSEPSFRWTMLFIMMNIITACTLLNDLSHINKKALLISTIVVSLVLILIIPAACAYFNLAFADYYIQLILFIICAIILFIYYFIITSKFKHKALILTVCAVIELGSFANCLYVISLDTSEKGSYDFFNRVTHVLQDNPGDLKNHLNSLEPDNQGEYYRVFVDDETVYWYYSNNMAINYQINGLEQYSSTYATSFNKMRTMFPQVMIDNSAMLFDIKDAYIMDFLSTKYAIVTDASQLPQGLDWQLVEDNYRGFIKIYRNEEYVGVARNYYSTKSDNEVTSTNDLRTDIICSDATCDIIKNMPDISGTSSLTDIFYNNNEFVGTLNTQGNSFMVLSIPFDDSWKIMINNEEITYYNVNGGFIGFYVPDGSSSLAMYFIPAGLRTGFIVSCISLALIIVYYVVYRKKLNKG